MKNLKTFALSLFLLAVPFLQGCGRKSELKAELVYEALYTTEENSVFKARFYSLSDKSLYFVKLESDGEETTLSRAVSASGERYIDETGKKEFLVKGNQAVIQVYSSESGQLETELKGSSE